ncbi:MAG: hypothetical protein Q8R40_00680 [bacterium]|nr:hypothetical protein [bacterium]
MNKEQLAQTNILDILELTEGSEQERKDVIQEANKIILDNVIDRIKEQLSPDQEIEFEHAFRNRGTEEERQVFLAAYVPNFEEILLRETLRFKEIAQSAADLLKNE